jgi:hypothetical protein
LLFRAVPRDDDPKHLRDRVLRGLLGLRRVEVNYLPTGPSS